MESSSVVLVRDAAVPASTVSEPPANSAGMRGGVALLLALAAGMAVANVYYAQPLLNTMAAELGIAPASIGLVMTLTQVGYGVGLLFVVPLGDLVDRRRLILGQSLLSTFALAAVALAPTAIALLAGVAVVGLLAVVTQVYVAHAALLAHPGERGRVVGVVTSGIVVGILLARTVSGTLADIAGWRSVYFASAAATLAVAAWLYRTLPRGPRANAGLSYPRLIASMAMLFVREPVLRTRATLALLIFAAITTVLTPLVLPLSAAPWFLSHTQVGLFGLAGAAGALGAARAGHWADRGLAQRTTGAALGLMLLAWLPISQLGHSLWSLAVGVVIIDFGLQAVHVTNQSLIYQARPDAQSRVTAGYMVFYSVGSGVGSILATRVYAAAGWFGVSALGASISALALVFWALTRGSVAPSPSP